MSASHPSFLDQAPGKVMAWGFFKWNLLFTRMCSIILVSPRNEVLLLHRVPTSTSFPSAHVFPGGNLEPDQDGDVPRPDESQFHRDGRAYRMAAVRECFEESGILLARNRDGGDMLMIELEEQMAARKKVHAGRIRFADWLAERGGVADIGNPKAIMRNVSVNTSSTTR